MTNEGYLYDNGMVIERGEINFTDVKNIPTRLGGRTFGGQGSGSSAATLAREVINDIGKRDMLPYLRVTDSASGLHGVYYLTGVSSTADGNTITSDFTFISSKISEGVPKIGFLLVHAVYDKDNYMTDMTATKTSYTATLTPDS